ncbi:hypothetical protein Bbelb_339860 [Branchiostoma belcheri]|nr:hypothetical protein Bbelb_339860 [Branchiostoma belcheri]
MDLMSFKRVLNSVNDSSCENGMTPAGPVSSCENGMTPGGPVRYARHGETEVPRSRLPCSRQACQKPAPLDQRKEAACSPDWLDQTTAKKIMTNGVAYISSR